MTVRAIRLGGTFDALRNRDFRWLWFGRLASSATFELGAVAQGWLVYALTGSAFALGWVGAGWSVATLVLSLYGGVITDRVEKRTLLYWARIGMLLNSFALGLLISLDVIQIWHLAASSLFTGIIFAFMMPAQQAIISDLVDEGTLLNAVSLNSLGMGLMGIFCASLAGVVIETIGVAGVYYLQALLYLLAVYTTTKRPYTRTANASTGSMWADLVDGIHYLRVRSALLVLLGFGLVRVMLVMPYRTLMPAFTRDVLGYDATGLGLLLSATGAGALISSLGLCAAGDMRGKGTLLLGAGVIVGVALMLFVTIPATFSTFFFIAVVGAANNVIMVMNNTLIQTTADVTYRGRVLSVYMMLWGLTPLGTIPAGALSDHFGVPAVIVVQGILVVAVFVLAAILRPEIKQMQ
jgi:MFS family permease